MTAKEKALELYANFTVYYFDESIGLMPDDLKTKYKAINVCDTILTILYYELPYKPEGIIQYWEDIKKEIKKI